MSAIEVDDVVDTFTGKRGVVVKITPPVVHRTYRDPGRVVVVVPCQIDGHGPIIAVTVGYLPTDVRPAPPT